MTEESYQQCRKVMASINFMRGLITKAKGEVAKWGNIEDSHRKNLKEAQANAANKMLEKAIKKLAALRLKFAELKFPDSNIVKEYQPNNCRSCGDPIEQSETHCQNCQIFRPPKSQPFVIIPLD